MIPLIFILEIFVVKFDNDNNIIEMQQGWARPTLTMRIVKVWAEKYETNREILSLWFAE